MKPDSGPPNIRAMLEMRGESWFFRRSSFPSPFSTTAGKESRRKVWPVGAVSNTTFNSGQVKEVFQPKLGPLTTEKSIRLTNFITSA